MVCCAAQIRRPKLLASLRADWLVGAAAMSRANLRIHTDMTYQLKSIRLTRLPMIDFHWM